MKSKFTPIHLHWGLFFIGALFIFYGFVRNSIAGVVLGVFICVIVAALIHDIENKSLVIK